MVLFVMFSVSAVSAVDANATDAGAADIEEESLDASEIPEESEDSSEISQSNFTDLNEDSILLSATEGELLGSDSSELPLSAGKVTINNIIVSANNVKRYYDQNGVLPNTVNVGGTTFTIHEFYYLMSKATTLLAKSDYSMVEPIMGVKGPSSKCTDTVYCAAVTDENYISIASQAVSYISKNRQVANYVDAVAGKIAYEDYVSMVARVLAFYYNSRELPNYVTYYSNDPSKVHYEQKGELNPFGLYGKNVWIDADGGSDAIKWKIAEALKAEGWNVYVGETDPNAHWEDYHNAKPGYVLINIYNGFCAGTMREMVTSSWIQNLLDTKHVVCVPIWDTSGWTEGMSPYRYGDFSGYSAKRAWDDDFSVLDPSIDDVDEFFRFYDVDYCAYPTVQGIIDQFLAGGYYRYHGEKEDVGTISVSDIVKAASNLKKNIESGYYQSTVTVGGETHSTPQFLYLMAKATELINSGKTGTKINVIKAAGASSYENTASGQLQKSKYLNIASQLVKYVSDNNRVPGYLTSDLGKIGYPELIDAFSRILAYYNDNGAMPNYVTVKKSIKLVAEYKNDKIVATATDANGNAVKGLKVGFAIADGVKYVTTDSNGKATYSTKDLPDNIYEVTVRVFGDGIYADSNKVRLSVSVGKQPTKIFLRNALYFVTETKIVKVTLWDSANNPIAGKTVYIKVGESRYNGVTDENGDAYIRIGIGFGVHDATVSFAGDDDYFSSDKNGNVRVIKGTPSVMVRGTDTQFKKSDEHKIVKVYLWDRESKPLPVNSKIVFKINGQTYTGFTDESGIASIEIKLTSTGVFNAQAMFAGNSAFNAVSRDIKITVS